MTTKQHATNEFRLRVVHHFEEYNNINKTIDEFFGGVTGTRRDTKRKSIYLWKRNKSQLEERCRKVSSRRKRKTRPIGSATTMPKECEEEIVHWIIDLRSNGVPVSAKMLQLKALEVANSRGIGSNFSASWMWRKSFLNRHSMSFRTRTKQSQIQPDDAARMATEFALVVHSEMRRLGVDLVYNADQTAVFFEYIPKTTIDCRGTKTVWIRCGGKEKTRLTCMLLGDSKGGRYDPFIIMKTTPAKKESTVAENMRLRQGFGSRMWPEISKLQSEHSVRLYANTKGWWTEHISVLFLEHHFGNRDITKPVLLVWDDFSGHWTDKVIRKAQDLNVTLLKVPPGCTGLSQPADVAWNRPFKHQLQLKWMEFMRNQLSGGPKEAPIKIIPPSRRDVVSWVDYSWKNLSLETIANGFRCLEDECNELVELMELCGVTDKSLGIISEEDDVIEQLQSRVVSDV